MRNTSLAGGIIILLSISTNLLAAEPSAQLMAGEEISNGTSYVYLGHIVPLAENTSGNGLVRRLWLDWSRYQYDNAVQTFNVDAPGAEIAIGYQRAAENQNWTAYAGLAYRNSSISPNDPNNKTNGSILRPKFQLEGEHAFDQKWKASAIGSYITGQEAYWVRGRFLYNISSGQQIGLEAISQGDPGYFSTQVGVLLLGLKAGNTIDVGLRIGARQVGFGSSQAYFGIELSSIN